MEWERERSTALPPPSPPPPLALATRGSLLEVRNREIEERREDSRDPAFRSKRKRGREESAKIFLPSASSIRG